VGGVNDLGTLGGAYSAPNGANNNGQVIGTSDDASGQLRPFVWRAEAGMVDLSKRLRHVPPSLTLETPLAISDNGAIVARASTGLVLLKPMNGARCTCPHTVGPLMGADMTPVGATFETAVGIGSDKPGARYRVAWSWGDGASVNVTAEDKVGAVVVTPGGARFAAIHSRTGIVTSSARHISTTPGLYTVSANVVDAGSGASVRVSRKIVVQPAHGAAGNKVGMY